MMLSPTGVATTSQRWAVISGPHPLLHMQWFCNHRGKFVTS
jgi:hypothetical protein